MFAKFSVDFLKAAPKFRPIVRFSSTADKIKKDWRYEVASPCDTEKILTFVNKHYLKEEPLFKTLVPGQKPKIVEKMFRGTLDHGMTMIARKCDDKEIIGVCMNERSGKLDGAKLCKIANDIKECDLKKLFEVWSLISSEPKLNEKLCQDEIFHVAVLSVCECHWGKGIGADLVKKSLELALDRKFAYAKMNATNDNTRKIAEKLNFEKFWCIPYKEALCRGDIKPRAIPEPPHTSISVFSYDLKNLPKKC